METELIGHLNDAGCRFMILLDTYCTKVTALRDRLPVEKFIVTAATDAVDGTGIQPVEPKIHASSRMSSVTARMYCLFLPSLWEMNSTPVPSRIPYTR